MNVPQGLFFTKEHEWVQIEGNRGRIGISDYAQNSLGDVTFVELPPVGAAAKQFSRLATVESVKAASDVYAPLSGKVVEVNAELSAHPELVNQSPYSQAWFVVIEIDEAGEKKNLMDSRQYTEYLQQNGH